MLYLFLITFRLNSNKSIFLHLAVDNDICGAKLLRPDKNEKMCIMYGYEFSAYDFVFLKTRCEMEDGKCNAKSERSREQNNIHHLLFIPRPTFKLSSAMKGRTFLSPQIIIQIHTHTHTYI